MGATVPDASESEPSSADLRTDVAHSARVYDYLLGGKDNYAADRAAAEEVVRIAPYMRTSVRANREFMVRVARYLAAEAGIRQFLDIGTGLPTSPNLHEVVQGVDPSARVVYADNDPIVLVHARALLTGTPEGRSRYIHADLAEPDAILASPEVRDTLDLSRPVALCLIAVLHFVHDEELARGVVRRLMDALPSGSHLALSTITIDSAPEEVGDAVRRYNARGINSKARTKAQVRSFFDGFELIEPGLTPVHHWRPDERARAIDDSQVSMYGGVAVKR
ncbi:SAM-dependent methyltransferase [Actinomadura geliboluensis]|uniref:SAM-dependent methyltransferase n=2 Tax=Actinomadura geliboluensis TaxID=882440 RepID=A0A5S4HK75_9ACTN|nr:SAM-dependent methyltransferase [Actinomadura geliboluensis]TMR41410.1 SAM-dependent methyltransferase [Actinomadura geliboluensis]